MAATTPPLPGAPAASCFFVVVLLLLSHLPPPAAAEQVLVGNNRLFSAQALYSRYRDQRFVMQGDCNVVLYHHHTPRWASNTGGLATNCQALLRDPAGYLVVSSPSRQIWSSTRSTNPVSYVLVLQNDLNVVVYSRPVWATGTNVQNSGGFQFGDQSLLAGSTLQAGQYLEDENMHFQLIMQDDCDFVLYDDGDVIWSSGTSGQGSGCSLTLTTDGQLVIRDIDGRTVWVSSNHAPYGNHVLVLQPDGNVVIYTGPVWETGTNIPKVAMHPANSSEATAGAQDAAQVDL